MAQAILTASHRPHPTVAAGQDLAADLRQVVRGEVRFDAGSRALYATDASNYRQVPIGVVIPRDLDDVVREFTDLTGKQLPPLNRGLEAKKLEPLRIISEEEWRKSDTSGGAGASGQFRGFTRIGWGSAF